jgi:HEAT repeat protein
MRARRSHPGFVACGLLAALFGPPPFATARAEGWIEALTELRAAPTDLRDAHRPLPERLAEARALGVRGPAQDAVPTLLEALQSKAEPALREEILLALARRASPAASAPLVALLAREEAPAPELATALSAIGDKAALAALTAALARPKAAAVAERALLDAGPRAAVPLAQAVSSAIALRAARLLGQLGPPAATLALPALLRALSSESNELRALAAESLGELGDTRSAGPLLALLSDPAPRVVVAALKALAQVATRAQAARLEAFFARAGRAQRSLALAALAKADPEASVGRLDAALSGSDPVLRETAVRIVEGERPSPSFVAGLGRSFARELRAQTASALSRVSDGGGVPVLLDAARRSPDAAQRAARALALGLRRFEAKLSGDMLESGRALLRSLPPGERRMLLCALARDPSVLGTAIAALSFANASQRATAARALGLLGDVKAAAAALSAALAVERDAEAKRRMLEAALELKLQVPLAQLWRSLGDPETAPEAMQLAAATADPEDPPRALRVFLRRVLSSRRPTRMRTGAALALAALLDHAARPALEAALGDASPRVRLAAVRALTALGGPAAAHTLLVHARVERDALVRRAALQGASNAGAPAALVARGELALELHVRAQTGADDRPVLEVLLEDGRWLRMRPLADGELIVSDLPAGQADVRAVD